MRKLGWLAVSVVGAAALGVVAFSRGENVNAVWLVVAAACTYLVAYRFYSLFIVNKVLGVDKQRLTPAKRHNDGLDFVPTHTTVLFGHHFAAIAGAGPLVGPVLAAQMGYLPGTLWLLAGVVFAGAVQDMIVLFFSTRRDGRSLGDMVRSEMGQTAGLVAMFGILLIMIIVLAVLALVVVKALAGSPWGLFTVAATIPTAVLMGVYGHFIRPGKIAEMSVIGFVLLMAALIFGRTVSQSETLAPMFTFGPEALAKMLIGYGFFASVLPIWLLLAPRDYLSTFLKIGAIVALALGICVTMPVLKMPAFTDFAFSGKGPVFAGNLFPFLFITIACGAVSGFHALISSGTTPKMLESESQIRLVGYGAMLMESFVAVMAMIAASVIDPGVYFAMNSSPAAVGKEITEVSSKISSWGYAVTPETLNQVAADVGEKTIIARAGGAPTLAVGMADIFSRVIGGKAMMGFWYHFAILFEALFILTAVDAGTRVARFMIQDLVGHLIPGFRSTKSWANNLIGSAAAVGLWGYILYVGVLDPLGGINSLWPLFGIANQMLAGLALVLCTVILFKMKRDKFAWVTAAPAVWLLVCTLTAGLQKIFSPLPAIGFLAHAEKFSASLAKGEITPPAKSIEQMSQVIFNDHLNTALSVAFISVVVATTIFALLSIAKARGNPKPSALEVGGAEPAGAAKYA